MLATLPPGHGRGVDVDALAELLLSQGASDPRVSDPVSNHGQDVKRLDVSCQVRVYPYASGRRCPVTGGVVGARNGRGRIHRVEAPRPVLTLYCLRLLTNVPETSPTAETEHDEDE
jgi:hypothetical protein